MPAGRRSSPAPSPLALDLRRAVQNLPDLPLLLDRLMRQIPRGQVATYGDLAEGLGSRDAARWVGTWMLDHSHDARCPCHRVVRSTGEPGQYVAGTADEKRRRLEQEGVPFVGARVDLSRARITELDGPRPLAHLAELQRRVEDAVRLDPLHAVPELVGGVDLSYAAPDRAVAAYALVETATQRLVWSTTVTHPAPFPYISGFLTFRELPALLALIEAVDRAGRAADVILVDGSGILHPRRAGIATCFGIAAGRTTIGVSKKRLSGQVDAASPLIDQCRPVWQDDAVAGMACWPTASAQPTYISPGTGIDVVSSTSLVRQLLAGHRLPEPLFHADALSRRHAQALKRGAC